MQVKWILATSSSFPPCFPAYQDVTQQYKTPAYAGLALGSAWALHSGVAMKELQDLSSLLKMLKLEEKEQEGLVLLLTCLLKIMEREGCLSWMGPFVVH